ncbi:hypothetical protein C4M96_02105 [Mycoplasmopsis pullorum]|uniref:hypothetical protein n=1 Tax=Mycoplasmopsis pullorum TaxID=48003 RepID=UPI00111A87D3|nr:hypothetical protein [Mycoplasmopsis pullorum]TNK82250.1 hypothetical protein C4M93_03915 [Mycoplasmopsis pullorum]TNK92088.1 hypothetical protein C4M96_02105 [Mycoplasmopsis pullorum]
MKTTENQYIFMERIIKIDCLGTKDTNYIVTKVRYSITLRKESSEYYVDIAAIKLGKYVLSLELPDVLKMISLDNTPDKIQFWNSQQIKDSLNVSILKLWFSILDESNISKYFTLTSLSTNNDITYNLNSTSGPVIFKKIKTRIKIKVIRNICGEKLIFEKTIGTL